MSEVTDHYYCHSTCDSCVCLSISPQYNCYNGPHISGPNNIGSAWCSSAVTVDFKGHNEGFCWPHHYAAATTTSVPDAFLGICLLCHWSSSGSFLFHSWASHQSLCWWLLWCLISAFRFPCGYHVQPMGGSSGGFCNTAALPSIPLTGICASWWWAVTHFRSALSGCLSLCFE